MPRPAFQPGFRLTFVDVLVLLVGAGAAAVLWQRSMWLGVGVAFVVGHFFLFCNVFRISRALELSWASVFVLLASITGTTGWPGWGWTFAGSVIATVVVVSAELGKQSYHGMGWQRVNPRLPAWWESQRTDE
ncbi:hypothetical protein N9N28_12430 [Rubripirellula amarantea]|nr:hypothetical protein [Rubripirellula amarantea]